MRKVLISLLLASAAASPALADPGNWSDRQAARAERSQAKEERQQARDTARAERSAPAPQVEQRPQIAPRPQSFARPAPQFTPPPQGYQAYQQQAPRQSFDSRRDSFNQVRDERLQERQQRIDQRQPGARVVDNPFGGDRGNLRQPARPIPQVMRRPTPVISDTPRPGTQPPPPRMDDRHAQNVQWNTNWRNNQHYDWQDYRRHHRSRFHLGFYFDPFGWGYSPFQIGWRLWPSYYSQRYWLNDPSYYGLPYAPAGYVWVRYWNDALLVDTWSGEVVDVIPDFFW